MDTARKITVEVPLELLEKAQRASGAGVTQTVRKGLQLVAASHLRPLAGAPRQGSLLAHVGGAEGRPVIADDTSAWVAFFPKALR
jgi:hypothetical protein